MEEERKVRYGILHNHTENSLRDSAMSIEALVSRAKELGAPAVALTDHGVMTGYIDFMETCKRMEIKPILGIEMYVEENTEGRKHLIVMAKNNDGFHALIKAATRTSGRQYNGYPRANKEILKEFFGPGTAGHGNVIATSACVSGVLASVVLANRSVEEDVEALKEKQKAFLSPESSSYKKNVEKRDALGAKQKELSTQMSELKKAAGKATKALYKKMTTAKTEEKREEARLLYEEEERKKKEAAMELEAVTQQHAKVTADLKSIKAFVDADEKQIAKWLQMQRRIEEIEDRYIDDSSLNDALIQECEWYREVFGRDNFYIELQNHGMEMEGIVYPKLAWLSDWTGTPVVAANDAHIPDNSEDAVLARAIVHSTRFKYARWYEPDKTDREVYLKSDEELKSSLLKILPEEKVNEAMENVGKIVDACSFELQSEDHYPKFKTPDGTTPEEYLRKMAYDAIPSRYPEGFDSYEQLEHELNVICSMGYADYFCIVEDFLRYARAAGKLDLEDPDEEKLALTFDTERLEKFTANRVGEYVGPGRGSAAGSIVCFLTGITSIDPIKYGLLFERFLNPERITMPDIDCDLEKEVRPYAIRYVRHKYGENSVCGIMTKGLQKGKAALLTAAKTYALKKGEASTYFSELEKTIAKAAVELAEDELNLDLSAIADDFTKKIVDPDTEDVKEVKVQGLKTRFASNRDALEIIHFALCIEGTCTQVGQHAAGIIVTDGKPVDDYVPLIMSGKDVMLTSCDMGQAEAIGLLKIDFLGLKNLTVISQTVKQVYQDTGTAIDLDRIPIDDADVYREIFAKANTNSVFQFESPGMKNMLKGFKPESIFDLTLLVAMFRPGPMQFLPDVIAVKSGKKELTYKTPALEPILKNTYGSITYQEQVQEIFKQLAGYSLGQADIVRRAMSKKKEKVLKAERQSFIYGDPERNIAGCKANGISEEIANELFDELMDFSRYAFNKSHAACYAVVAYQTAWLKYHYPKQYMRAVLDMAEFDDIPKLCGDLRYMGIEAVQPDVNISDYRFRLYDGKIYFGLSSIKGLGESVRTVIEEREQHGPYRSFTDFMTRALPGKKDYMGLVSSGALDHLCQNRKAMEAMAEAYDKPVKAVRDAYKKLHEAGQGTENFRKLEDRLFEKIRKLKELVPDTSICDDPFGNLKKEKELLGEYMSGHPLDHYPPASKLRADEIRDALEFPEQSKARIAGIVSNVRIKARKSDGKPMAFFDLSDKSGTIHVCCFTKAFAVYADMLEDDRVVVLEGKIMLDSRGDDGDDVERKLSMDKAWEIEPEKDTIIIYDTDPDKWQMETLNRILPYSSRNGNPVQVYFSMFGEFRETDLLLNPLIVQEQPVRCSMQKIRM